MKNSINEIIEAFTGEEFREFKYFLRRRKGNLSYGEDFKLVELIRKGVSAEKLINVNAYHQTRKRIKKQLEQFYSLQNILKDETSKIYNLIEASKFLFRKNLYRQAWQYIIKAEKAAMKKEEYELLDYIYFTQISYASDISIVSNQAPDIINLIRKKDANAGLAKIDGNANTAYAFLVHNIRELFSKELYNRQAKSHSNINSLIAYILKHYQLEDKIYNRPRIYIKIVNIVCRALREKKDYLSLRKYSLSNYHLMKKKKMLDKIPSDQYMELIRSIYQSSMRTRNYDDCEHFQELYDLISKRFKSQEDRFVYYNFRSEIMAADLFMCTNRLEEARTRLLSLNKKYANNKKSAIIYFYLRINLLAMYFKFEDYDKCKSLFNGIIQQYQKKVLKEEGLGLEMLLYTEIFGAIVYFELDDIEYSEYLLKRIRRKYSENLNKEESNRESQFIRILSKMLSDPSYLRSSKFKIECETFTKLKDYLPGDREYISLNAWLQSKCSGKSYYKCFLETVS